MIAPEFQAGIAKAIEAEVRRIVEAEAKKAALEVENRVRAMIGQIAAKMVSELNFERFGQDLRITVRFPDRGKV